jgi:two-component system, NarL family, sensor histidine kinase UhpB
MQLRAKHLFSRGPEPIEVAKVSVREVPLEEIGLTLGFILLAAFWLVFSGDIVDAIMGVPINSAYVQALRGINFTTTTGIVLYLVLRRTLRRKRQAEEALRLNQQRFESVALATTDAIWDLNLETKVVWWSEGMGKLFGYRQEDVSSKFEWWFERVHPEDRDRVTTSIQKVAEANGQHWSGEYRFRRQDGSYATVLDRGYIVRDSSGKPARLVGGLSDVSEQRMAERALENSRQQLRALAARVQSSREEERARVAREIHDDLGQILTAIKMNLDWLERHIEEGGRDASLNPQLERVVESGEMIETAMQSVQRIAEDLRPAVLDHLGLSEALKEEVRRFQERSSVVCTLDLPGEELSTPAETAVVIFRIAQEALTNVARHAHAANVSISLTVKDGRLTMTIQDDGQGIQSEALTDSRSLGLLGMTERAVAVGGRVSVAPASPQGTRVTLELPEPVKAAVEVKHA